MPDQSPWERYAQQPGTGPWEKYGAPPPGVEAAALANPPVASPASWQQPKDPYSGQAYGRAVPPSMAANEADIDRTIGTAGKVQNLSITPVTNASTAIMPAAGLGEVIAEKGVVPALGSIGRGLAKSAAGATVGGGVGGALGAIAHHPKEGAEIGATIGGVSAPFLPNRVLSSAPYGLSRLFLSNEELAGERAAMKLAQRSADVAAGLREEKLPLPQRAYAEMEEDLAPKPTAEEIAQKRLGQKVANISAEVRAGLRPGPEEQIQSALEKEFLAGESTPRPRSLAFPAPKPGVKTATSAASPKALGSIGESVEQPSGVLLAPIRSGPFPNNPAGNIQNVPRDLLPDIIARTGDPAAVREFTRTTNTPTLFVPESYGEPRSVTPLGEITNPGGETGTLGRIKAGPTFKSLPESTSSTMPNLSGQQWSQVDAMVDRLSAEPGMDRLTAHKLAEGTVRDLNSPNSYERDVAQQRFERIMRGQGRQRPR